MKAVADTTNDRRPHVLLLGGGHAHVEVVRSILASGADARVTLVSSARHAPYSGMLPGFIAGRYRFEDFHIDLQSLSARSGVVFHVGTAVHIDPDAREVRLANGETLGFDLLSIDIGSTPSLPVGIETGVAVKPIASFTERLAQLDETVGQNPDAFRLVVIGQGIAGVEIALALKQRFAQFEGVSIVLAGRGSRLMPERGARARRLVGEALARAGIDVQMEFDAVSLKDGALKARDGRSLQVDEVVWTTSSAAPPWLAHTGLALDRGGFVQVDAFLRSVSHPWIFAAGDVAALPDPRPKAGVFAVRSGPFLTRNLIGALKGESLRPFKPQRAWLALVSLGDGRTVADKWGFAAAGRWVTVWKHWNDTRFVKRFAE